MLIDSIKVPLNLTCPWHNCSFFPNELSGHLTHAFDCRSSKQFQYIRHDGIRDILLTQLKKIPGITNVEKECLHSNLALNISVRADIQFRKDDILHLVDFKVVNPSCPGSLRLFSRPDGTKALFDFHRHDKFQKYDQVLDFNNNPSIKFHVFCAFTSGIFSLESQKFLQVFISGVPQVVNNITDQIRRTLFRTLANSLHHYRMFLQDFYLHANRQLPPAHHQDNLIRVENEHIDEEDYRLPDSPRLDLADPEILSHS